MQLEVLSVAKGSAVGNPNTVNDGVSCFLIFSRWIILACILCSAHYHSVYPLFIL